MLSVNRQAMVIVRHMLAAPGALGVHVSRLRNGTTVIDTGQEAPGSWQAGKDFSLITMGGLADVTFTSFPLGEVDLPAVQVMVDRPVEACVASQISGWRLTAEADAPILSGPARALNRTPDFRFATISYRDQADEGVITIQTGRPVTEAIAQAIADSCGLAPQNLYILTVNHNSLVAAIEVPARIIDQALHRLMEEGFDVNRIQYGAGTCPVPPLAQDVVTAFGRINDALVYGGEATLYVEGSDEALARLAPRAISAASRAYGRPFAEIYEEAGRDFYAIPRDLHSPAVIHLNNVTTGHTFSAGEVNRDVLRRSFFGR